MPADHWRGRGPEWLTLADSGLAKIHFCFLQSILLSPDMGKPKHQ